MLQQYLLGGISLEQWLFVLVTLGAALLAIYAFKGGYPASIAVFGVAWAVWYFGPAVFGRAHWFRDSYWDGFVFGNLFGFAMLSTGRGIWSSRRGPSGVGKNK